jgi:hypothetical protein
MNDNLSNMTDSELSGAFAVEVAGYVRLNEVWVEDPIRKIGFDSSMLKFSTSMDAVLPWLAKRGWTEMSQSDMRNGKPSGECRWRVRLIHLGQFVEAIAPSLPRAACITLIMAARYESALPNVQAQR